MADIGLVGLGVMGQNLALNIAEKGFSISVYNRTTSKVDDTVEKAKQEGAGKFQLHGYHTPQEFVASLARPRKVIMLVMAGSPVDQTIAALKQYMEKGDIIIDGGNEWYKNTERRSKELEPTGIHYMGMGVSGGEEGARHGPSLMPGGPREAFEAIKPIVEKIAAQVDDGPCVTYIGPGGSGNYVKMIHNGIEYGDMQLIAEAYDILHRVGGLSNDELAQTFDEWNQGELKSFLIEITAQIFKKKDTESDGYLVDKILDMSGSKGTGMWTVQEAAERGVPAPTIAGALDARYMSALKEERVKAAQIFGANTLQKVEDRKQLIADVKHALYASKIISYTQGMNIIREASKVNGWNLNLGDIARIWKGGCIIRAVFLDRITAAYRKSELPSLLVDPDFANELKDRVSAWRRVVCNAVMSGLPAPTFAASLAYFDAYRSDRLSANLIQAQRDFFGAHTFKRTDKEGVFHAEWNQ